MASALKHHGYTAKQLKKAGFSIAAIKHVWPSVPDLREAGFSAAELRADGFTAMALKKGGYSHKVLKRVGLYSAHELRKAGFSASALKESGHSFHGLLEAGFPASEVRKIFPLGEREKQEPAASLRGTVQRKNILVGANRDKRRDVQAEEQVEKRQQHRLLPDEKLLDEKLGTDGMPVQSDHGADLQSHDHDSPQNMQEGLGTDDGKVVQLACGKQAQTNVKDSAQSLPDVFSFDDMQILFFDELEMIFDSPAVMECAFGKEQGESAYQLKLHRKKQRRTAQQQQLQSKQHQRFRPGQQKHAQIMRKQLHSDTWDLRNLL
jgi:hypothetical protein